MRNVVVLSVLVVLVVMPSWLSAQGVSFALEPGNLTVQVGETFELECWVGNLGNTASPALGSYAVALDYDSSLFTPAGVTFGPYLGDPGSGEATTSTSVTPGTYDVVETSLLTPAQLVSLQPGSFVVFRARFTANAEGTGGFTPWLGAPGVTDENGVPLDPELGAMAFVEVRQAAVPALSGWGIGALAAAVLVVGVVLLRRRW